MVLVALLLTLAGPAAAQCVGDCDGDVTVTMPPGTRSPTVVAPLAAVGIVSRLGFLLQQVPHLPGTLSIAAQAAANGGACPLGGSVVGPTARDPTSRLLGCSFAVPGGRVAINGTGANYVTFLTGSFTLAYYAGATTLALDVGINIGGTGTPLLGGSCLLSGFDFEACVSVSAADMLGHNGALVIDRQPVVIDAITYDAACVPQSYRIRVNGPLTLSEAGSPDIALTAYDLTLVVDASRTPSPVLLSGGLAGPCLGGYIDVATVAPLAYPIDSFCPESGAVDVGVPIIRYASGDRVDFDADGDGTIDVHDIPHCFDAQALTCG